MLQCVAVCCSVLQCAAACCSACCSVLWMLQCVVNMLQVFRQSTHVFVHGMCMNYRSLLQKSLIKETMFCMSMHTFACMCACVSHKYTCVQHTYKHTHIHTHTHTHTSSIQVQHIPHICDSYTLCQNHPYMYMIYMIHIHDVQHIYDVEHIYMIHMQYVNTYI